MPNVNSENIKEFQDKLIKWFRVNGRKFPWRNPNLSSYKLVIAEVLLQRTKAENVSKFYNQFVKEFPNWTSLVIARQKRIERFLKPLGLFKQRARRLKMLSIEMKQRKSRFPKNRNDLEQIPLVGQYIANSIELLVFKKSKPLLDVNMARVLERYFRKRYLADIRYDPYLQKLSHQIVYHKLTKDINWTILDFAATTCLAINPKCDSCIFKRRCSYLKSR